MKLSDADVPERRPVRETVKAGSPNYCGPSQSRVVKPRLTRLAVTEEDENNNCAAISCLLKLKRTMGSFRKSARQ